MFDYLELCLFQHSTQLLPLPTYQAAPASGGDGLRTEMSELQTKYNKLKWAGWHLRGWLCRIYADTFRKKFVQLREGKKEP